MSYNKAKLNNYDLKLQQDPPVKIGNCYHDFPELYDLLYQRYLKTIPTFIKLVSQNTPVGGKILDIAAGTGEVTLPLLKNGYRVTSFDKAAGMLAVLKTKVAAKKLPSPTYKIGDIHSLNLTTQFDTICIRQAINYFNGARALLIGLRALRKLLKPEGRLIFNAPNITASQYPNFPSSFHLYRSSKTKAFVLETNYLHGPRLTHRQDSMVWNDSSKNPSHFTDTNSFYLFKKQTFEKILRQAGFNSIKFYSSNLVPYSKKNHTLYGAASV